MIASAISTRTTMRGVLRQSVLISAITWALCGIALLLAQGRLFPRGIAPTVVEKPMGDACFIMSLPGTMVAVGIWGYNSGRTVLSDVLIVTLNAILYAIPVSLFVMGIRYWRARRQLRQPGKV